jgi:hypothetical protein
MHTTGLRVLLVCGGPVGAMLMDKILAVINGEIPTSQDFEDYWALSGIYQPDGEDVDRQQALQRFVEHALLRQEALRTHSIRVDEAEGSQHLCELDQQPARWEKSMGYRSLMYAPGCATNSPYTHSLSDECGFSSTSPRVRLCGITRIINKRSECLWTKRFVTGFGAYGPSARSIFD